MEVIKISPKYVGSDEVKRLHPHFGLIRKDTVQKVEYYREIKTGELWEATYLR